MDPPAPISRRALVGYGIAGIPTTFGFVLLVVMFMKFAVDELGASPSAVGAIFLVARVWDAISDPLVGHLSDRTNHARGRRRPWILVSAPLLALSTVLVWSPPEGLGSLALHVWIALSVLGFYTSFTLFEVPHTALGAELSFDGASRNRLFGVRQILRTVGMFAGATLGVYWVSQGRGEATGLATGLAAAILVLVVGGMGLVPPERSELRGRGGARPWLAIRDVFRNRHARLLLFVFFVENLGAGGIGVLVPFVTQYVMKMNPTVSAFMIGGYMLPALLAVPLWIHLARRFEKRRLWLFAMVQSGVGFGLMGWVGEGDWPLLLGAAALAGSAGACANSLGYSIKAEVIDYDEYRTGERKEGAYFATWGFVSKLASGVMVAIVGLALDASGFVSGSPDQTETVLATMRFLIGGLPMAMFAIGSLVFLRFRLGEAEHTRIRAALDAR